MIEAQLKLLTKEELIGLGNKEVCSVIPGFKQDPGTHMMALGYCLFPQALGPVLSVASFPRSHCWCL